MHMASQPRGERYAPAPGGPLLRGWLVGLAIHEQGGRAAFNSSAQETACRATAAENPSPRAGQPGGVELLEIVGVLQSQATCT
jgi:hypothetical protein